MKKTILLFIVLCASALSYAATRSQELKPSFPANLNSLQSHEMKSKELLKKTVSSIQKDEKLFIPAPGPQKAPLISEKKTKDQLDSVVYVDDLGNKLNKMEFYYNQKFWPVRQINSIWDSSSQEYLSEAEYILDWSEDGFLMTYTNLSPMWNEGVKIEYTYNEQGLGVTETISILTDGNWEYILKNSYKYDERGNTTELLQQEYQGAWVNLNKEVAAYDANDLQILWEGYSWEGSQWVGHGKEEYTWLEGGEFITSNLAYQWDESSSKWIYNTKFEQAFENGKIILQQMLFWNKEKGDWSGETQDNIWGDLLVNWKTDYTYDNLWRQTREITSNFVSAAWQPSYEFEYIWGTAANGEMEFQRNGYLYESGTNKDHNQILVARISPYYQNTDLEKYTYRKETHKIENDWQDLYEEEYAYDQDGRVTEEKFWLYEDNVKYADSLTQFEYNSAGQETQEDIFLRKDGTDTDWSLSSTIIYEYENDIAVRRYQFRGEERIPSSGDGVDFDFNVPVSDMIVFIEYSDPYKILYLYEYNEGSATEFSVWKRIFYYSKQEITGIQDVAHNHTFAVYPNPATDMISVRSSDATVWVTISNINGMKVLQTSDKQINVSSLTSGIYIIDVNGVKSKLIKK
jgi:hypothetical protein